MNILSFLSKKFQKALIHSGAPRNCDPIVLRSTKSQLSDYQVNGIIKIAKKLNLMPMELAKKILIFIDLNNEYIEMKISKPGFINIILNPEWIAINLKNMIHCSRLKIDRSRNIKKIVVDYSSPNIAKEMHVGHLRSTVIGDCIVRLYEFFGHKVIRSNHIGDWGTQFGMLISYLKLKKEKKIINLSTLEKYYKLSKIKYSSDPTFAQISRKNVVLLQKKDNEVFSIWKRIVSITNIENEKIYKLMRITLRNQDIMAESSYNEILPNIVKDLEKKKIAIKKNNSLIVFLNEFKNRLGQPMGVIIQKSDGAYLYTTIDIACLKYRKNFLQADKILYFIDSRQKQHLKQVELICKKANYIPKDFQIEHHVFGMVLSKNKTPFKTRSGNTIKLIDLLNESKKRAKILIKEKNPNLTEQELNCISEKIGIGSIKYFELSKNRISNYIFDWKSILSLKGNTSLYIQYTYVRILSLFKKSKIIPSELKGSFLLHEKIEIKLGLKILQFEENLIFAMNYSYPHIICLYLYELSVLYSSFYEKHKILFLNNKSICNSRLLLSFLTSKILKKGLNFLGISTVVHI